MKKTIMSLALLLVTLCCSAQMQYLPIDPQVRVGKLDNGLTYYIRHNEEPKGQADFFIAQKVGSMQEEDDQQGLAHFLEHMCFNGTTHFPGKGIIEYLSANGVKFGYNLNAYTSMDETVYNISSVPLSREGLIDSCLLVLHDWSHDLLLEDAEIDAERGVIHEEWRGSNATRRMYTELLPHLFPGDTRYGHRMPIGTMEVVDNFPYQALRDYYHKWYRPDLQAIIVVGDIDVDAIEGKIKSTFADVAMPENPAERTYEEVPGNAEPIVAFVSDKEQQVNSVMIAFKNDKLPQEYRNTPVEYANKYVNQMIGTMLNARLAELLQTAQPPFMQAVSGDGEYFVAMTKDAFMLNAYYADGGMESAFKAVVREFKRACDFGFTQGEYDRARAEYLRGYEKAYEDRAKTTSTTYAKECARHFTQQEPMPGIEMEYQLMKMLAPQIPLGEGINAPLHQMPLDTNLVMAFMNTETERKYTREEVLALWDEVMQEELEPYVDKVSGEPIMSEVPQGGAVKSSKPGKYGTQELTLTNGVRVVLKPTDFKKDEILFFGTRDGGTSLYELKDMLQVSFADNVHSVMGLGNFSATDLDKALAGKVAGCNTRLTLSAEQVNGSCSPRDLRTMLQLCYLQFQPSRTDREAFESYRNRTRDALKNQDANPGVAFSDSLQQTLYAHHPRLFTSKAWMMDKLNLDSLQLIYNQRFNHADGFTFYLVGNVEADSVVDLVATYLGALPVAGVKDKWIDRKNLTAKGKVDNFFTRPMTQDKATTVTIACGKVKYNLRNNLLMDFAEQMVDDAALLRMREEIGGTYSPSVQGALMRNQGRDEARLLVYFECDPAQRDLLLQIADECIDKVAEEGPSEEVMEKTRQYLLKNYAAAQTQNSYWMGVLRNIDQDKLDVHAGYEQTVNSITAKDVQAFVKSILKQRNRITISMTPEK